MNTVSAQHDKLAAKVTVTTTYTTHPEPLTRVFDRNDPVTGYTAYAAWAALADGNIRDGLDQLRQEREHIERMTRNAVDYARQQGATWQEIADGLGVSRQAAQKKYGTTTTAVGRFGPSAAR